MISGGWTRLSVADIVSAPYRPLPLTSGDVVSPHPPYPVGVRFPFESIDFLLKKKTSRKTGCQI